MNQLHNQVQLILAFFVFACSDAQTESNRTANGGGASVAGAGAGGSAVNAGGTLASGGTALATGAAGSAVGGAALLAGGAGGSAGTENGAQGGAAAAGSSGSTPRSCKASRVICAMAPPNCQSSIKLEVPELTSSGDCYTGRCVAIDQCACTTAADCPEPQQFTCWISQRHCGPFVD